MYFFALREVCISQIWPTAVILGFPFPELQAFFTPVRVKFSPKRGVLLPTCPRSVAWSYRNRCLLIRYRCLQHTPGTYPRPSTICLWRNSFHLRVWGCLGYAKQGYVGVLLELVISWGASWNEASEWVNTPLQMMNGKGVDVTRLAG